MKPNYMVIGAAKCASSTICTLLGQHPDVFMVECKEPHFFSKDEVYARGFSWYESLFSGAGNKRLLGEGSNSYSMREVFPKAASRIAAYVPDLKLIYLVRDPITRIESYWLEKRSHGGETVHYDFNKAVRVNRDWLVDSSNYWHQIDVYRSYFSDSCIHVIFYEDFRESPIKSMRECYGFLGVDSDVQLSNLDLHINSSKGKLVPRDILSRWRSNPTFRSGVELIPMPLRKSLKRHFFSKEFQGRPRWKSSTREWVADILGADTKKFLEYCGKPKNFWRICD